MTRKKWTEEKIIEYVESEGYKFIEFIEYKGVDSTVLTKCPNREHDTYKVNFYKFFKGQRCRKCRSLETKRKPSK